MLSFAFCFFFCLRLVVGVARRCALSVVVVCYRLMLDVVINIVLLSWLLLTIHI